MMRKTLFLLPAVLALVTCGLRAQTPTYPLEHAVRYGVFADWSFNWHTTDFHRLPGIPNCCEKFTRGDGGGIFAGAFVRLPLAAKWSLDIGVDYGTHNGLLSARENALGGDDSGNVVPVTFEHRIDAKISSIGLEPILNYNLVGHLSLMAGGRFGVILGKSYNQSETIVEPVDRGYFTDTQTRTRNVFSGTIPDIAPVNGAVLAGLKYALPLKRDWSLMAEPEILFSYQFTNVVKGLSWTIWSLRAGVRISLAFPEAKPVEPPPPPPPPKKEEPVLTADITASGIDPKGGEFPVARIVAEEFISTEMQPVLNYVFFDDNSSAIPKRYAAFGPDEAVAFSIDNLYMLGTLDVYYNVLNIIGKRMLDHPGARLTLTGCNSGAESDGMQLSKARAAAVKNYLVTIWKVDAARITVLARNLPEKPSNMTDPDGIVENRRVEIQSDTWEILEPVTLRNVTRTVNPPVVRFTPRVTSSAGVRGWSVVAQQGDRRLKSFAGDSALPRALDWRMQDEQQTIPTSVAPLVYRLRVTDNTGKTVTTPDRSLDVEQITVQKKRQEMLADREIDRYSLILFDFDSESLNPANERIAGIIRARLTPASSVRITGYSDRIGDAEHNLRLSEGRALNTAKALGLPEAPIEGLGESVLLFNNDLPEGRFYSRTVVVVAETPITK